MYIPNRYSAIVIVMLDLTNNGYPRHTGLARRNPVHRCTAGAAAADHRTAGFRRIALGSDDLLHNSDYCDRGC